MDNPLNSELTPQKVVRIIANSCRRCKDCIEICPEEALAWVEGRVVVAEEKCTGCGRCVQVCKIRALKLMPK